MTVVASQVSSFTGKSLRPGRRDLMIRDQADGITVLRAYSPANIQRGFTRRLFGYIVFSLTSIWAALRAGPVDVVMGTSPPIFQAVSAWMVARIRRKPFLLEVRDLWPEFAIDLGILRNPALIFSARWIELFLYQHADHILVNSPAYRDYLIRMRVPNKKISFVPNGADVDMFDPGSTGEAIRKQYGFGDDFIVVYAGTHGRSIDLDTLIDAAERFRDRNSVRFVLVGDGMERPRLIKEAKRRGLEKVTFLGPMPKARMPEILAAADVCVAILRNIPMFTMTYPNKVFDYMAAGRPTVLAIDGVIRQVVEDAGGGIFVPPGNPDALAAAIAELKDDPSLRVKMGESARKYVERHFNRDDQAEEFREILHRLYGPPPPQQRGGPIRR